MDALKKAELAKQNASSQPSSGQAKAADSTPEELLESFSEETIVLDESVLQPPPELLEEATKDADWLTSEEEQETTEKPSREYAYEWVDELHLLDENKDASTDADEEKNRPILEQESLDAEAMLAEIEQAEVLEFDKTQLETAAIAEHQEIEKQTEEQIEEQSVVIVEKTPEPVIKIEEEKEEIETQAETPQAPIQWLDDDEEEKQASAETEKTEKSAASSKIINWVDDDNADDEAQARLAAEQLLRAESRSGLQKKTNNMPLLLGFLVLLLVLLGGGLYALNTALESMSQGNIVSKDGKEAGANLEARAKAANCKKFDISCIHAYEAKQKKAQAATPATAEPAMATAPPAELEPETVTPLVEPMASRAETEVGTSNRAAESSPNPTSAASQAAQRPASATETPSPTATQASPTELAAMTNLLQAPSVQAASAPSNTVPELHIERPQGKFYDGMKQYELDALAEDGFFIRRQTVPPSLQYQLEQAYAAYQGRDLEAAKQLYQAVLRQQPKNRDALLGIAALAQQQGHPDHARAYYHRVLHLYPDDAVASAGLISLQQQAPSFEQEQDLLNKLEKQATAHWLHFALGNLYSRQGRWREAEEAYFEAYRHNPQHPDYIYNLAVSLEHLNKARTALRFYEEALKQVENGAPANFQAAAVRQRIVLLKAAD